MRSNAETGYKLVSLYSFRLRDTALNEQRYILKTGILAIQFHQMSWDELDELKGALGLVLLGLPVVVVLLLGERSAESEVQGKNSLL